MIPLGRFIVIQWSQNNVQTNFTAKKIWHISIPSSIRPKIFDLRVLYKLRTWNCFCSDLHSCRTISCSWLVQNAQINKEMVIKFWHMELSHNGLAVRTLKAWKLVSALIFLNLWKISRPLDVIRIDHPCGAQLAEGWNILASYTNMGWIFETMCAYIPRTQLFCVRK